MGTRAMCAFKTSFAYARENREYLDILVFFVVFPADGNIV